MDEQSEGAVNQRDINEQLVLSGLREQALADALQEGEERYRSLFSSAPMAVFVCDRDGVIQYYNQRAADLWGREPVRGVEQYCGSVTLWLPDGTLLPHAESPMVDVLRTGIPAHNVEVFIERPDGTRLPVLVNFAALRSARGEITGAITSFIDITERTQAEEALRQSEKKYRTLFESIDEGFCIIEKVAGDAGAPLDFRYVEANPAFAAQSGLSGVVGKTIRQVVPGEPEEWFDTYDTVVRTGEPIRFERGLVTQGRVLELYAFRVDDETHARVAVIFKDITARKHAEERIHESEEKFRTLADNMSQFAWMTDATGWIFWYNQRWYEFTGTTLAEMQGWGWQTVHHPDHVESVVEKISHCFQTGEVWEDTFPLRGRDGNYRWFLSRAIPIRDGDGRIVRWFGTNTDIDEQKRAEMALRVAQEQKEQFIASLAHDLKTPLTTIKGAAQLLARRADRSGTTEMTAGLPRLHAIDDAATRMVGMIDALLDAARARGGYALDLARSATDLVALARRAIAVSEERGNPPLPPA